MKHCRAIGGVKPDEDQCSATACLISTLPMLALEASVRRRHSIATLPTVNRDGVGQPATRRWTTNGSQHRSLLIAPPQASSSPLRGCGVGLSGPHPSSHGVHVVQYQQPRSRRDAGVPQSSALGSGRQHRAVHVLTALGCKCLASTALPFARVAACTACRLVRYHWAKRSNMSGGY